MAVEFLKLSLYEAHNPKGIVVLDSNLQCIWMNEELDMMRYMYPRLYKCYRELCRNAYSNTLGRSLVFEDSGQKFAILFTKKSRKDSNEEAIKNFKSGLAHLTKQVSVDKELFSGIIGRDDKLFNNYLNILMDWTKEHGYHWNVCRMQRSSK